MKPPVVLTINIPHTKYPVIVAVSIIDELRLQTSLSWRDHLRNIRSPLRELALHFALSFSILQYYAPFNRIISRLNNDRSS